MIKERIKKAFTHEKEENDPKYNYLCVYGCGHKVKECKCKEMGLNNKDCEEYNTQKTRITSVMNADNDPNRPLSKSSGNVKKAIEKKTDFWKLGNNKSEAAESKVDKPKSNFWTSMKRKSVAGSIITNSKIGRNSTIVGGMSSF